MQFLATSATAAVTALVSSLSYAQPVHVLTQNHHALPAGTEVSQMISRPKLPVEFAMNLKYIFDHDLLLQDDFYSEANLKNVFALNEVSIVNENHDISITANNFSGIFPRKKASELFGGSVPSASLVGGKTPISDSTLVKAGINFGFDEGGPTFQETLRIFGEQFVRINSMPSPHGGPLPATAAHGNETWKYEHSVEKQEKSVTLGFNRTGELSNALIQIN